ncbi:SLATT domain-containing protein [Bacillus nitratireducens]|uniref:SLATT domain-containing protein n=1 Tax=Bacillus nitratireducens TaxID=2026193 RepID=UPI0011A33879|nr:SLATT domain-containing protein [Bacillus nitratireducens]
MDENIRNDIEKLIDRRVWVTKKARMEAEARMNRNNFLTQLLVNYYTFVVLAFSIWTLVSEDSRISLLTVIASVGLFGISIFVGAMGYREKALQYKDSYLSLNKLESNLRYLLRNQEQEDKVVIEKLKSYEETYAEILAKSENHADTDYIKVRIKHGTENSASNLFKYYIYKVISYIFGLILILAPIIGSFLYLKG